LPDQSATTPVLPSPHGAACVLELSSEGAKLLALLFPQLVGLRVHRIEDTGGSVVISASCVSSSGRCPACGAVSARAHGGYWRTVADGAAGGRPVLIILRALRFLCVNPSCPKVTFALQAAGLTSRYCRRSVPLTQVLAGLGLEGPAPGSPGCWASPCTPRRSCGWSRACRSVRRARHLSGDVPRVHEGQCSRRWWCLSG
jgi:transposase